MAEARRLLEGYSARLWQESVPDGREKFSSVVLSHNVEPLLQLLGAELGTKERRWMWSYR